MHKKIRELSSKRIKYLIENQISSYEWHKTFLEYLKWEIDEVIDEIKDNNSVYLEDELWDVFWVYLWLLHSLENEWKITGVDKVLERCYDKFTQRVWVNWEWGKNWNEIKVIQKEKLKQEHNKLYNNDK